MDRIIIDIPSVDQVYSRSGDEMDETGKTIPMFIELML